MKKQSQNKPNSNPNKANFRNAKMNVKLLAKKSGHTRSAEITKIGCVHISKKYNVLIRKVLDSQTNFVVKNGPAAMLFGMALSENLYLILKYLFHSFVRHLEIFGQAF